jgi:pullulanase/glycogen debranching enzyme
VHGDLHAFVRAMLGFRRAHPVLRRSSFYTEQQIKWFGPGDGAPDWSDPRQKCLGCMVLDDEHGDIFLAFNAATELAQFALPTRDNGEYWYRVVDTAAAYPEDFIQNGGRLLDDQAICPVAERSVVILVTHD